MAKSKLARVKAKLPVPAPAKGRSIAVPEPEKHHTLAATQQRGLGLKVSDEFTVPLCAIHHSENHATGDERKWWSDRKIDPLAVAQELWKSTTRLEKPAD